MSAKEKRLVKQISKRLTDFGNSVKIFLRNKLYFRIFL